MKEAIGNLWDFPADALVITTNGYVKSNGRAVMGRGCAREARDRYPGIDKILASQIKERGNNVSVIWEEPLILSFPVKHNWWEVADLQLIKRSAEQLCLWVIFGAKGLEGKEFHLNSVYLPRPGCGNGQLDWKDVKPIIEPILPDEVTVVSFA